MYERNGVDNMEKLDFIKPDRVEKMKTKFLKKPDKKNTVIKKNI